MNDVAWALQTARGVGPVHAPHAHAHPIHKLHTGPLHSTVAGRTDHLPSNVPNGSYVLPADIVSAMGEGNTMAGFKVAKRMFEGVRRHFGGTPYAGGNGPYGQSGGPYGMASGGSVGDISNKWGQSGVKLDVSSGSEKSPMEVGRLVVPPSQRGQGIGSSVMRDLTAHADENGRTMALTPSTDFGGSSVSRVRNFYKKHGFVDNAGRNKDFAISHGMYRLPQKQQKAYGGQTDGVPVAVAGGEHVLAPHEVAHAGLGDMEAGHRALDAFVIRQRANTVKTLRGLPGPKQGDE